MVQAFTDDALTTCEQCSGRLRKLFNSVGVVFKGSGFYRTDSRESAKSSTNGSARARSTSEGSASSDKSSSSEKSSSSSTKSESRQLQLGDSRRQLARYPQAARRRPRLPPAPAYRCSMGESLKSLNPSLPTRISQWLRPDWSQTVLARRIAAAGLVVLAGVAAWRPDPDGDRAQVVVAAHDLPPGAALTADDVRLEKRLVPSIPDGSQSDLDTVVGSTLAGPARRGEVLTDVRLLGRRLAESAAGPDARIVPVHPADSALADLVRAGDIVDVVAGSDTASQPKPTAPPS